MAAPSLHVCNYANDYAKIRRATTLNYATNYAADLGAHRLSSRGVAPPCRAAQMGRHRQAGRCNVLQRQLPSFCSLKDPVLVMAGVLQ